MSECSVALCAVLRYETSGFVQALNNTDEGFMRCINSKYVGHSSKILIFFTS